MPIRNNSKKFTGIIFLGSIIATGVHLFVKKDEHSVIQANSLCKFFKIAKGMCTVYGKIPVPERGKYVVAGTDNKMVTPKKS